MDERTRIALLITELRPAGAERVVYDLATRLDRDRFDVRVCSLTSRDDDDGAIARDLEAAGIPVFPARMRSKLDVLGARRLARGVAEFRPHILHAHLFHANLAARLLGRRVGAERVVSTIHIVERRPLRLRRILERLGVRRDDVTVCVSEAVARHARDDLGVANPRVVYNGIDVDRFLGLPAKESARRALGLPTDGPLIGCVGRLSHQKGVDVLLRAFATMSADSSVVVAGEGEEESVLRVLARDLGVAERVHFVGFQDDVRGVLAAIDAFCMPSRWEGFGLALVEALAAGVPVVATGVDSIPEVMGDAGVRVPPDDVAALASALDEVLREPRANDPLCDRGRAQAARFGVDSMVAAYDALYSEIWPVSSSR